MASESSSIPPNPNHLVPPITPQEPLPPPPPTAPSASGGGGRMLFPYPKRPSLRVTSEFDSESSAFFHKVSCKLLDNLAKLKLAFQSSPKGEIAQPQLSFISKHLSIHYDVEEQNTLLTSSFDVGTRLHFKAAHDVKAQQGEVSIVADLADPSYAFELNSPVPAIGMPRATLKFPLGEVSLLESQKEVENEEVEPKRALSLDAILKQQILSGLCTAHYKDDELKLRYCYKDDELSFIPSISLPSNALSFAFKRRFTPPSKLSYWYNFDTNYWSTVYKHTYGKDFKVKAGYDSEVRLGWASLWDLMMRQIIGKGHEFGGLYILDTDIPKSVACSGVVNPFEAHCQLGYSSLSLLKKLYPQFHSLESLHCESCQYAKHHRVSLSPRVNK